MIKIGKIVNTKGLKGEVRILSNSDFKDERFKKGSSLEIKTKNGVEKVTVDKWSTHKNYDIIKLKEYNYVDQVERFKGAEIFAEKLDDSILDEGEFYFSDLIGFKIEEDNVELGEVYDVYDIANKTYLRVRLLDKQKKLIPYIDDFIKEVDLKNKVIKIKTIPGLLDD